MRLAGIAALAGVAVIAAGCGLDLGGLEDTPGGDDAGLADVVTAGDGRVSGNDAAPEATPADATSPTDAAETGSAADAPGETAADSPPPPPVDAGCKTGVVCDGNCTSASDCAGCGGANLLCQATNTCTSDCTMCPANPIQCFACDMNRLNPIGTCEPDVQGAYCLDENYANIYKGGQGYHCACIFATDCPADTEVCIGIGPPPATLGCFTCGEAFTDKATCKDGQGKAMCNAMMAMCK
jgi:hypothetical protein